MRRSRRLFRLGAAAIVVAGVAAGPASGSPAGPGSLAGPGSPAGPGSLVRPASGSPAAARATAGLAYVTGTATGAPEVWVSDANGRAPSPVATGVNVQLAPDGRAVAVTPTAEHGPALIIYGPSGEVRARYLNITRESVSALAWSPDSRYLAVAVQDTTVARGAGRSALLVIDLATGAITTVVHGDVSRVSFAPQGGRVVFGLADSEDYAAPTNLYSAAVDGSGVTQLTRDGHSFDPVWGADGIAFDRWRFRGPQRAAVFQIWLLSGKVARQITHTNPPALVDGLVPLAVSAQGDHLLAEYEGQDTSQAYCVNLPTGRARRLTAGRRSVTGAAISRNGRRVLVVLGGFMKPPSAGEIATLPFAGGPPTVLVRHGAEPSWNR